MSCFANMTIIRFLKGTGALFTVFYVTAYQDIKGVSSLADFPGETSERRIFQGTTADLCPSTWDQLQVLHSWVTLAPGELQEEQVQEEVEIQSGHVHV